MINKKTLKKHQFCSSFHFPLGRKGDPRPSWCQHLERSITHVEQWRGSTRFFFFSFEEALDWIGHMLLTFKDGEIMTFQKKYGGLIVSHISLKGRKYRAHIFVNHSLRKKPWWNVVSIKCFPFVELKYGQISMSY